MAKPESEQNLSPSQQAELQRQEEAKREATELLDALREIEGKKALLLIVR